LLAGCASPRIIEFTVQPEVICPCDPVTVHVVAENTRRDTITFDPASAPQIIGDWLSDARHQYNHPMAVCESTNVTYLAHRDGATDVTDTRRVEVVHADHLQPFTFPALCEGGVFHGFRPVDVDPNRFSPSLIVLRATNNSDRTVRLSHDGGTFVSARAGEDFAGFAGLPFARTWSAGADLMITDMTRESCIGGDGRT